MGFIRGISSLAIITWVVENNTLEKTIT